MALARLAFLIVVHAPSTWAQVLCRTPGECGQVQSPADCGVEGGSLERFADATICLGFQAVNGSAAEGTKALFRVQVDTFSKLRVDTRARRAHALPS